LRTPFAGLRAQAELAKREQVAEPVRDALERICVSAQRCSHLVTQLLTLARNEPEARQNAALEILDLHRVSQEIAAHWAPDALQKNIDIGFEAEARPFPVKGDEAGLRDLIDNLIDNAIRYGLPGGRVEVTLGEDDSGIRLKVADDGPGIPADERERVFERFYRLDRTQRGTGLGLPIVQHAVHSLGGRLEIGDGLGGRGIAFSIVLPHHTPAAGA
jgi:two-component system sensor histidine kinase TctE